MKHLLFILFTTACLAQHAANQKNFSLDHITIEKLTYKNETISSKIVPIKGDDIIISSDKTIILNCTNPNGLAVNGVKVNDAEEKLKSKFPKSCQL